MRTAKYHDYTVLKIVLFIILVILGLFIYNSFIRPSLEHTAPADAWETVTPASCTQDGSKCRVCTDCGKQFDFQVIPATGHKEGDAVKENEKAHTRTEGGSYEMVKYCTVCNVEIPGSREKEYVNGEHKPEITEIKEFYQVATCNQPESYELTVKCSCGEILEGPKIVIVSDNFGHDYNWTLEYDPNTQTGSMVGSCTRCNDYGSTTETFTTANGTLSVARDANVSPCCGVRYIGSVKHEGTSYTALIDFAPEYNHTVSYHPDNNDLDPDNMITEKLPDIRYDERTKRYYYDISEANGIVIKADEVYDDFGFIRGVYKCVACAEQNCQKCGKEADAIHYFTVHIYNPEKDKSLNP